MRKAKQEMWDRWTTEYVRGLREKHDVTKVKPNHLDIGEIVLVVGDAKNRHEWQHGLVAELLIGKDEVVRGVRMVVNNKVWERPIQLMCSLEIKSTLSTQELNKRLQTAMKKEGVAEVPERPRRATRDSRAAEDQGHY